jgi:hypothetical protein
MVTTGGRLPFLRDRITAAETYVAGNTPQPRHLPVRTPHVHGQVLLGQLAALQAEVAGRPADARSELETRGEEHEPRRRSQRVSRCRRSALRAPQPLRVRGVPQAGVRALRCRAFRVDRRLANDGLLVSRLPRAEDGGVMLPELIEEIEATLAQEAEALGNPTGDDRLDRLTWLRLIDEHRIHATRYGASDEEYRRELVAIAALAVAAIEACDRSREEIE